MYFFTSGTPISKLQGSGTSETSSLNDNLDDPSAMLHIPNQFENFNVDDDEDEIEDGEVRVDEELSVGSPSSASLHDPTLKSASTSTIDKSPPFKLECMSALNSTPIAFPSFAMTQASPL